MCYVIPRPTPSELRLWELCFVLTAHSRSMSRSEVLLHVVARAPNLMPNLTPSWRACLRCMSVLNVKSARVAIIPVVESFDGVRGTPRTGLLNVSTKEWDCRWDICSVLCCICKRGLSTITSASSTTTSTSAATSCHISSSPTSECLLRWDNNVWDRTGGGVCVC